MNNGSLRYLSINQLAEITGKDRRTIKKKLAKLNYQRDGRGYYYDAHEALPLLFSESAKDIDKKLQAEQLRYESARAEKLELEVKKLRGEVVPIEEVAKTVEREYAFVRAHIRAIPSKLAKPLSMTTDPHEIYAQIESVVNECLTELTSDKVYAERSSQLFSSDNAGEEVDGVSEESIETDSEVESG